MHMVSDAPVDSENNVGDVRRAIMIKRLYRINQRAGSHADHPLRSASRCDRAGNMRAMPVVVMRQAGPVQQVNPPSEGMVQIGVAIVSSRIDDAYADTVSSRY
ncbi:hypothetical protein D3C77_398940 [compost metagenome]